MKLLSKFKNSQVVFVDGQQEERIKRTIKLPEEGFVYEMRSGGLVVEDRISLLKY